MTLPVAQPRASKAVATVKVLSFVVPQNTATFAAFDFDGVTNSPLFNSMKKVYRSAGGGFSWADTDEGAACFVGEDAYAMQHLTLQALKNQGVSLLHFSQRCLPKDIQKAEQSIADEYYDLVNFLYPDMFPSKTDTHTALQAKGLNSQSTEGASRKAPLRDAIRQMHVRSETTQESVVGIWIDDDEGNLPGQESGNTDIGILAKHLNAEDDAERLDFLPQTLLASMPLPLVFQHLASIDPATLVDGGRVSHVTDEHKQKLLESVIEFIFLKPDRAFELQQRFLPPCSEHPSPQQWAITLHDCMKVVTDQNLYKQLLLKCMLESKQKLSKAQRRAFFEKALETYYKKFGLDNVRDFIEEELFSQVVTDIDEQTAIRYQVIQRIVSYAVELSSENEEPHEKPHDDHEWIRLLLSQDFNTVCSKLKLGDSKRFDETTEKEAFIRLLGLELTDVPDDKPLIDVIKEKLPTPTVENKNKLCQFLKIFFRLDQAHGKRSDLVAHFVDESYLEKWDINLQEVSVLFKPKLLVPEKTTSPPKREKVDMPLINDGQISKNGENIKKLLVWLKKYIEDTHWKVKGLGGATICVGGIEKKIPTQAARMHDILVSDIPAQQKIAQLIPLVNQAVNPGSYYKTCRNAVLRNQATTRAYEAISKGLTPVCRG